MCRSHKQSKQKKRRQRKGIEGKKREKKGRGGKRREKNKQKWRNGLIRQKECGARYLSPFHSVLLLMHVRCDAAAARTTTRRPAANCCSHLPSRCALITREFFNKRTVHKYVKAAPARFSAAPVPISSCCFVIKRELISSRSRRRSSRSCSISTVGVTAPRGVTAAWLNGFERRRQAGHT